MNANKQKWNQINQNTRNEIFTNTFRLLELADFKSAAPIALTYLCIMDTETNTWRQLVKTLEMNLTSQNNPHDDNQVNNYFVNFISLCSYLIILSSSELKYKKNYYNET